MIDSIAGVEKYDGRDRDGDKGAGEWWRRVGVMVGVMMANDRGRQGPSSRAASLAT